MLPNNGGAPRKAVLAFALKIHEIRAYFALTTVVQNNIPPQAHETVPQANFTLTANTVINNICHCSIQLDFTFSNLWCGWTKREHLMKQRSLTWNHLGARIQKVVHTLRRRLRAPLSKNGAGFSHLCCWMNPWILIQLRDAQMRDWDGWFKSAWVSSRYSSRSDSWC